MKKLILIICLIAPVIAKAGGPSMPEGYRMPDNDELSLSERSSDKYRYSLVAGDFNGDGLVDGAFLSIDNDKKELAVFAFLCTDNDQVFKWYKVASFEYKAIKYTGLRLLKPKRIIYFPNIRDESKKELSLSNYSFELFQFEGSSSVFYYDEGSNQFKRIWVSK